MQKKPLIERFNAINLLVVVNAEIDPSCILLLPQSMMCPILINNIYGQDNPLFLKLMLF
ncbi:hypothetical protein ACFOQM_08805 [Paenibacillus sp. GCM10012307]|uniref:Uncharacterized protein n=1 Tax=Paenibacillus roseus TaxID=2798579 RepID=A0A934J5Y8_9BACL|nr:hypothetical protein [Paenibacillus roseus]MBJ6361386.1 hypothetical protein [Paenibacillus roseus]